MTDGIGTLGEVVEERVRLAPLAAAGLDGNVPCLPREIFVLNLGSGDFEVRYVCPVCEVIAGPAFRDAPLDSKPLMLCAMQDALADFEREALAHCPRLK